VLLKATCLLGLVLDLITTGRAARVVRERPESLARLVFVQPEPGDADKVQLLGMSGSMDVGDLYEVVDPDGLVALARVTKVERTDEKCQGYFYVRASGRVERHRAPRMVSSYQTIGIGPVRVPDAAPRVLSLEGSTPAGRAGAPPPGWTDRLQWAVDRDGDGVPDLARYVYDCGGDPHTKHASGQSAMLCLEDWARQRGAWRVVSKTQFACR
jgi:hypothetical protein